MALKSLNNLNLRIRIDVPVAVVEGQPVLRPRGTANHSTA